MIGLDPSAELLRRTAHLAAAEAIPLAERSVDAIVMSWTLCSLGDARAGLGGTRWLLRPEGERLFV